VAKVSQRKREREKGKELRVAMGYGRSRKLDNEKKADQ
jgi:hypothetical protein